MKRTRRGARVGPVFKYAVEGNAPVEERHVWDAEWADIMLA